MKKKKPKISVSDLAQVGRETPTGEWFRRYWLVVGTTQELRDIPIGIKVLGEELVLLNTEHTISPNCADTADTATLWVEEGYHTPTSTRYYACSA